MKTFIKSLTAGILAVTAVMFSTVATVMADACTSDEWANDCMAEVYTTDLYVYGGDSPYAWGLWAKVGSAWRVGLVMAPHAGLSWWSDVDDVFYYSRNHNETVPQAQQGASLHWYGHTAGWFHPDVSQIHTVNWHGRVHLHVQGADTTDPTLDIGVDLIHQNGHDDAWSDAVKSRIDSAFDVSGITFADGKFRRVADYYGHLHDAEVRFYGDDHELGAGGVAPYELIDGIGIAKQGMAIFTAARWGSPGTTD